MNSFNNKIIVKKGGGTDFDVVLVNDFFDPRIIPEKILKEFSDDFCNMFRPRYSNKFIFYIYYW